MNAAVWPIALAVISNIVYHICAKSAPEGISPFASLTVTYAVAALVSLLLFLLLGEGSLARSLRQMNWTSAVLGVAIVGLEAGFLYAYRLGWTVSTAQIVQCAFLSIALLAVGALLYGEAIGWSKIAGAGICLVGLYFLMK